ncbi:HesA/MoeB/ThiF family protein [Thalassomonas haliotis]|uniref:HesA/MoeB/ThiF family protein n=1 Tax=Thalassomonas haliotis TaxID=485448 RepID=A0ABY7V8J9_9GAMM|nr:HesA/MoeB/ThiF family protein [Thalassomonas haliotis]WDE09682.1 HesA/MoeB/ThiF family protein [Thalassomonas haliotis]
MNSANSYHFNPFSFVTRINDEILINTVPHNRATFSADFQPVIDFFLQKEELSKEEILKCIAPSRLEELVSKRILLEGPAQKLEGRYSRQLGYFTMISKQPEAVQEQLQGSHALILGVGAIGSHICWNLAAIGVGKITLLDFDTIEESNLNRQLMYTPQDIDRVKVDVLAQRIREFNPEIQVATLNQKITCQADVEALLPGVNLLVKAIDSPEDSMAWVNAACVKAEVPYVTGGFLDYTAVAGPNYIPGKSSCFACQGDAGDVQRLHGTGPTFGPLTTLVTSMLSMIAFKILIGKADGYANKVYMYNADNGSWDMEQVTPALACKVCGASPAKPEQDTAALISKPLVMFRSLFVAVLILTVILGEIYQQPLVGVMTFFGIFIAIPVVKKIHADDLLKTRREFFVMTCIYIGFSLIGLVIGNITDESFVLPTSLRGIFDTMQLISATIIQATISIAIIFLSLCGVMEYGPKLVNFLNEDL